MFWDSPAKVSSLVIRVPLGLTLILAGSSAYRDFEPFIASVTDGLGWVTPLAVVWAYFLPLLLIVAGGLLAVGRYSIVAGITGGLGLGSIPLGLILRNVVGGVPLPDTMVSIYPSFVWLLVLYVALRAMPEPSASVPDEEGAAPAEQTTEMAAL